MEKVFSIEPLLDAKQVRTLLRVSLPLIYKMAEDGRLPCVRIPCPGLGTRAKTLVRFKAQDIHDFVERHHRSAT